MEVKSPKLWVKTFFNVNIAFLAICSILVVDETWHVKTFCSILTLDTLVQGVGQWNPQLRTKSLKKVFSSSDFPLTLFYVFLLNRLCHQHVVSFKFSFHSSALFVLITNMIDGSHFLCTSQVLLQKHHF